MKIYIACHDQHKARRIAGCLICAGHEITANWLSRPFGPSGTFNATTCRWFAMENFDDVRRSDALVLIAGPAKYSGGKFMEAGYAYGLGKHVLILGRRENLQLHGRHMKQVRTRAELLSALSQPANASNHIA